MAKRTTSKNNRTGKMQTLNRNFWAKGRGTSSINKNAKSADRVDRKSPGEVDKGQKGFYRTKATIKRLLMYREKPKANQEIQVRPNAPARIQSNRLYFGNTRTIDNKQLEKLRKEYQEAEHQEKKIGVILKKHKIPVSLLTNNLTKTENNIVEPFDKTFGPKMNRKKPKLNIGSIEELAKKVETDIGKYDNEKDSEQMKFIAQELNEKKVHIAKYMTAGQSKRIYRELHKVMDSSDVICQIIDARDPMGTRSTYVENFVKNHCPHKHIVIVLNKCDLVPTWVTAKWISYFSKYYPSIAFHASINNPFGKPALFQVLRQYDTLHKEKKHISVGFVGYPNVGKSSVINTLKKQNCCKSAPVPGETRVWQYVSLTKRIYLIDCPGVVYDAGESDTDKILKGVLRCEKIEDPLEHIAGILDKVSKEHIEKLYGVSNWVNLEDFVSQVAVKYGKLGRGGDPDLKSTSKIILMDWQRGKIPYYIIPKDFDRNNITSTEEVQPINKNNDMGIEQTMDELKQFGGDKIFENEK